ncbi:MAG: BON domain-containing protein [Planctomycetota bacterium]|jgi:hyperosmotically inducible protein
MAVEITERRDLQTKRDVLSELEWDPRVDATDVGVEVRDRLVTLTGRVGNYAKKIAAQEAAHRVKGVLDVANEIEVELPTDDLRDEDIARAVRCALEWDALVPDQPIMTTVTSGWVTLTGTVERLIDREEASRAVRSLRGVVGVSNDISVREKTFDTEWVRRSIEEALARLAHTEAEHLRISVEDDVIQVAGKVRSTAERRAVLHAASCAPGVRAIEQHLVIDDDI